MIKKAKPFVIGKYERGYKPNDVLAERESIAKELELVILGVKEGVQYGCIAQLEDIIKELSE